MKIRVVLVDLLDLETRICVKQSFVVEASTIRARRPVLVPYKIKALGRLDWLSEPAVFWLPLLICLFQG